jgi:hypothetical protein
MTPDDFREGVLRIFPRELPQQIQIACHSHKYIAADARNPTKKPQRRRGKLEIVFLGVSVSLWQNFCHAFTFGVLSRNLDAE